MHLLHNNFSRSQSTHGGSKKMLLVGQPIALDTLFACIF
jgi:hypothetical protein